VQNILARNTGTRFSVKRIHELTKEALKGLLPQGDRILSCSGEHHQQIVFVETTEKSFLSQAHVV
jgi:hypothetical protein